MTLPSTLRKKSSPQQNLAPSKLKAEIQPDKEPTTLRKKVSDRDQILSDVKEERDIERAQARTLSRGIESALGAPGNIASFVAGLFGKEQHILPTSQKLQSLSEKATGGYTAPQSEFEEGIDELVSDISTMALPGGGHYSFARNIGIPVVGNLIKQGLKYSNSDERNQAYGKVGTMVALDLLSRRSGGTRRYVNELFQKAEASIPKGMSIDASGLSKKLETLEKSLSMGGSRPSTSKALTKVEEIRKDIKNGKIDAKTLASYRPSINEAIDELGGFQLQVPKKSIPKAIKNLNDVKSEVISTLEQYGRKFNPEFLQYSQAANESFAAIQKSNLISKFLQEKVPFIPQSKAVQSLFSYGSAIGTGALALVSPQSAAGAAGAVGIYNAIKILNRFTKSPTLRKYYLNTIKEAASGNIAETTKNLKALDKLSLDQEQLDRKHKEKQSSQNSFS